MYNKLIKQFDSRFRLTNQNNRLLTDNKVNIFHFFSLMYKNVATSKQEHSYLTFGDLFRLYVSAFKYHKI